MPPKHRPDGRIRTARSSRHLGFTIAVASAFTLIILIAGCGSSGSGDNTGKLNIVATTTQLGDIVGQVGGDAVDVHQLLQPNTDPHEYEPRPDDVTATANAKIVFESGDGLDTWMDTVVSESGGDPQTVVVGDSVPTRLAGEAEGDEASEFDPHWWHDPENVEAAIPVIRDSLVKADPARKAAFEKNAAAYLSKVRTLDVGIRRCFSKIPVGDRKLVTSHDAFGYFANRYDVKVIGAVIPSQTTQAQPSAGELSDLSALVRKEGVKAIFPESSINPKLEEALAAQTGADAGYTLYGDTLGPSGSSGDTYLKMEAANADAMLQGLSGGKLRCEIPGT